jgi:hypothetical protein
MAGAFQWDSAGLALIERTMAEAMDDLGARAATLVVGLAPNRTGRYRRSIGWTTYAFGKHFAGKHLKNIRQMARGDVMTVVYSSSSKAHLLERGTTGRTVVSKPRGPAMHFIAKSGDEIITRKVHQPPMARQPHFGPAAIQSVAWAADIFRARFGSRMP